EVAARLGNLPIAERRLLGLMQALALSNDPNARLVVASGTLSRGKLAKAIASQLGDLTGQGKGVWRSAARETAKQIKAKEITYHGIFQLSQDEVDELIRTEASARQATLSASLREAQEEARFSRLLSGNVRRRRPQPDPLRLRDGQHHEPAGQGRGGEILDHRRQPGRRCQYVPRRGGQDERGDFEKNGLGGVSLQDG
ncbi:MAG: hypothetical protein P8014_19980, partial [Acidihalobacter sp.]|uniref:hypothetical protein n=1 Tax=Acidihalobacter sp. TaxID=1872108 RepID=UPI00307CDB89